MTTKKISKTAMIAHLASRLELTPAQVRQLFEELTWLSERELRTSGEFVLPGLVKLVMQKRKAREGRNPITGQPVPIPARTALAARIAKPLKLSVLAALARNHDGMVTPDPEPAQPS